MWRREKRRKVDQKKMNLARLKGWGEESTEGYMGSVNDSQERAEDAALPEGWIWKTSATVIIKSVFSVFFIFRELD